MTDPAEPATLTTEADPDTKPGIPVRVLPAAPATVDQVSAYWQDEACREIARADALEGRALAAELGANIRFAKGLIIGAMVGLYLGAVALWFVLRYIESDEASHD